MAQTRIMIIGSDSSSDLYGSKLVEALKPIIPELELFGVGGSLMEDAGVELLYDISDLENLGGFEALRASHVLKRLIKRVSLAMDEKKPQLVIQIGMPVFSLKLIELAKSKNITTAYYNSPLNWSDADLEISRFAKIVDKVIGTSRYETDLCLKYDIDVEFAGHPLVDIMAAGSETKEDLQLIANKPVVVLLPGMRETEVKEYLPTLLKAIKRINLEKGIVQTILAVPEWIRSECWRSIVEKHADPEYIRITSDIPGSLQYGDVAVVKSESESIMVALSQVPAVAVHRVATTTYFLNKMQSNKTHFAMINFLMQEEILPELVQNDFSESKVAETVTELLYDQAVRNDFQSKLRRLPEEIGVEGTIDRAAKIIANMLKVD